jgi:hypothetical protein
LYNGMATLRANGFPVVSYNFDSRFSDRFGIGVHKSSTKFSDVVFEGESKQGMFETVLSWFN